MAAAIVAPLLVTGSLVACQPLPSAPNCSALPDDNIWHADISKLPVNSHSAAWLASTGASSGRKLHPDFGPSGDNAHPYGIPVTYVAGTHAKVTVSFDYADESDKVGYPLGSDTVLESGSDAHALIVDKDNCKLYETWDTRKTGPGWAAGSGAVFDLRSDALRPNGWTSADAAGLPIMPGLLRLDEVEGGTIDHAVRVTFNRTDAAHLWPARHDASSTHDVNLPPMGARFRLKANYSLTGLRPDTQAVLRAFQKYGVIAADNGSDWYFGGTAQNGWPTALLDQLKAVPASAFEAVDESSLMVSANSGQARQAG
jgi:hypothetical protein